MPCQLMRGVSLGLCWNLNVGLSSITEILLLGNLTFYRRSVRKCPLNREWTGYWLPVLQLEIYKVTVKRNVGQPAVGKSVEPTISKLNLPWLAKLWLCFWFSTLPYNKTHFLYFITMHSLFTLRIVWNKAYLLS